MTLTLCHTLCWNHYEERSGEHDDDSKRSQQNIGSEYAAQAKASWGKTAAYKEFEQKAAGRTKEEDQKLGIEMMDIFRELGEIREHKPDGTEAIALAKKLQEYITRNFYNCTDEILLSLGGMYAGGGDFTTNIDKIGGEGTAEFACRAIEAFVAGKKK